MVYKSHKFKRFVWFCSIQVCLVFFGFFNIRESGNNPGNTRENPRKFLDLGATKKLPKNHQNFGEISGIFPDSCKIPGMWLKFPGPPILQLPDHSPNW